MNLEEKTENFISRQIVTEIINFGVTQNQILNTIYLLSLELEDRNKSVAIAEIIKGSSKEKTSGLIVDP